MDHHLKQEEKGNLIEQINSVLDEVRPHLLVDGGNVEIVDLTNDDILLIKWVGNCEGCTMSMITMKAGIEATIKNKFPFIKAVEAVNGIEVNG